MTSAHRPTVLHPRLFYRLTVLLFAAGLGALAHPGSASAANACIRQHEGGIGGTGVTGGIGGTGIHTGGIGGTGRLPRESGIGGTGVSADEHGLGGTGMQAKESGLGGTGIVGIITGFGSICVNEIEVQYDRATPVEIDGVPAYVAALALGQVVSIEARGTGPDVRAHAISIRSEVFGPVSALTRQHGEIQVLGQTVRATPQTRYADLTSDKASMPTDLKPGDYIRVSGLRQASGAIIASRIERTLPRNDVGVNGVISQRVDGSFYVHGVRVEVPPELRTADVARARGGLACGSWDGTRLRLQEFTAWPAVPFAGRVRHLELQGYLTGTRERNVLTVGHIAVHLSPDTRIAGVAAQDLVQDQRVRVTAHLDRHRRVVAERIELDRVRPESREPREREGRAGHGTENRGTENRGTESRGTERGDNTAREGREGPSHGSERVERVERVEDARGSGPGEMHAERVDRPEHPEHAERPETPERAERPETPESVERPEAPERAERPERVELPEVSTVVERVERPEKRD